ncbi:MAG: hypothetical protein AMXMBFR64_06280 [Myxococcales bacterium]
MRPDELRWTHAVPDLPDARRVDVKWLGTAGYELRCGDHVILIDPYVTRVGLWGFLTGPIRSDEALASRVVPVADAILVGHSHFDHVLDVPAIARATGARVIGSSSTANLMRSAGLPEAQITPCSGGEELEVGPFRVRVVPSEHSRFALGGRVPYAGEIPCSCDLPMRGKDYKCGQVLSYSIRVGGVTLYHAGSANLLDDAIQDRDVDLLLVCISGRQATERFVPRLLSRVQPRRVMPMHYDDFFRPLDRDMKLLPMTRFGRLVDEIQAFDKQIEIATLPLSGSLSLAI